MGKPRMIILIRHAQSEGNKNRDIHQFIPDHRVKLTQHGWTQAEEAGRSLRSLLKPDDTLQFFTSPYRRTRETTEGILRTLTSDDPTPSPFPRNKITVFEEPRLREQDFGNFQPCSAEMERMWQERADYGHFFYRIPDGESAADAYDRVSGFNESLWRSFSDDNFPSVCVLVTHGLMSRVFLMKWYHWSVEYFEDLRNVNHCEFIIMKQSENSGRYILQNELRTWSELKRRAAKEGTTGASSSTPSRPTPLSAAGQVGLNSSPIIPTRRWGGCVNGCNHDKVNYPRRPMRKNTMDFLGGQSQQLPPPATSLDDEKEDHPAAAQEADHASVINEQTPTKLSRKQSTKTSPVLSMPPTPASPNDASNDASSSENDEAASALRPSHQHTAPRTAAILRHLQPPQKAHGDGFSDDSDYFPGMQQLHHSTNGHRKLLRASSRQRQESKERKLARRQTEQSWREESGMGTGARTDRLGDGDATSDEPGSAKRPGAAEQPPILREALKGDMIVEKSEEERERSDEELDAEKKIGVAEVERMKEAEKRSLDEVY
ncbi:phosphoglycerate mutase family protein [Cucurbitaria berberidis CBS 394.84]|uniref:Phosphoglycerate mutase family protein n=1 Tax=Cucurbitaria berberidis CBS 394.84 TaxID=1168544 RepID=A0A9P4GPL2_9PLEO|nr:phosphoglycerate mutase family protein [Cucurbitaria berberidis CBS 394.84]KAF1849009.1 phosphoglycerate mutase family protein [Cucurbitaria berberidis CBS 394.84]